jgi:hypothetical protein
MCEFDCYVLMEAYGQYSARRVNHQISNDAMPNKQLTAAITARSHSD